MAFFVTKCEIGSFAALSLLYTLVASKDNILKVYPLIEQALI